MTLSSSLHFMYCTLRILKKVLKLKRKTIHSTVYFIKKRGWKMRKLLGRVDERNNFYNFYPIFELENGELKRLTRNELDELLNGSIYPNINLAFKYIQTEEIRKYLCDSLYQILELDTDDMEINYKPDGSINQTKYKIEALKTINAGKLYDIDREGYYIVVPSDCFTADYCETEVIEIDAPVFEKQFVVLEVENEDMFLGPYEVKYRSFDDRYIVNTHLNENKYTLSGYDKQNCRFYTINNGYEYDESVLIIKAIDESKRKYIDAITEDKLLEIFKDAVSNDFISDGKLDLSDIDAVKNQFEQSMLIGNQIDTHIRNKRLQFIAEKLEAAFEMDDALKYMSETLGNSFFTLMERYQDNEDVQQFVNKLFEFKPDFLDNIKSTRAIQERIDSLLKEEQQLSEKISDSRNELENIKNNIGDLEQQAFNKHEGELVDVTSKKEQAAEELEALYDQIGCVQNVLELREYKSKLEEEIKYNEWREEQLKTGNDELQSRLVRKIDDYNQKMYDVALDGFIANKMMEVSSNWESKNIANAYDDIVENNKSVNSVEMTPEELKDYLYDVIRIARPTYDKNTIVNLAICFTQGFLTVLSGKPGCGKTSICNLYAKALGLYKIREENGITEDGIDTARFIPISVERGWTSKRDLIGYYNPLTKSFDKSNKHIYDALQILSREKQKSCSNLPYMILLDEANLSPMEYYWADFMNVCDDLSENSVVNLGGDNVFKIPETLHFMATINNDHTTETLSPRLIDRAWIVTLPKSKYNINSDTIPDDKIKIISWKSIKDAFMYDETEELSIPNDTRNTLDKIISHFEKMQLFISPRTELAVLRYCNTASKLLERDSAGRDASTIALDFAVSQKILPKITGYGDEFKDWLTLLAKICSNNALYQSENILKDIIASGENQMKYYQFF